MLKEKFQKTILINSSKQNVWAYLTNPFLMVKWMGDKEMNIEIFTDWKVGSPIEVRGYHHSFFENKGSVLQYEPYKTLSYSHLSSISELTDTIQNYSIFTFNLEGENEESQLRVEIKNFPTLSIYHHLNFYWQGTLGLLKKQIEESVLL